ncbi:histidine phosphatase family protein [Natronomonas marina]|jgi:probable phosphoglycerate mutase|uniref:histidine phosphatase family protein n=1 Tax=Natronomonas marina TaxID=2961939 RepID=UPI0020C98459|nr:histidine phosphatase family protein [Natronomonas marina]
MTRVVAVRHGETHWNRNGRMQGWAPTDLNDTGREQASAAGGWLADAYDVDRVFASDLRRTRATADRIGEALDDAPVEYDPAWRERDMGVYQGLTYEDVEDRFPEFGLGQTAYEAALAIPEGGESLRDMADRVTAAFNRLVDRHPGETVLVVTHGGPLHVLLGYVKGMALQEALGSHHMANCGVNEIRATEEECRVVSENVTDWR